MLGSLLSVFPLWQSQKHFTEERQAVNDLHDRGIEVANHIYKEEQALESALHRRDMALSRELHCDEVSHALEIARREAVRDVWSQKNQVLQTIMMVDTLTFGCTAAILVEGDISEDAPLGLVRVYAIVLASALSFLLISLYNSAKLQQRMTFYDMLNPRRRYVCGKVHLNFNDYYQCHCYSLQKGAILTFYAGLTLTVAAGGIYASSAFWWDFAAPPASVTFALLSLLGVIVSLAFMGLEMPPIVARLMKQAQRILLSSGPPK